MDKTQISFIGFGNFGNFLAPTNQPELDDKLPPFGELNAAPPAKATVVEHGKTPVAPIIPQPQKAATRRTKGLETRPQATRKLSLDGLRALIESEAKKRQGPTRGQGQALLSACEFALRCLYGDKSQYTSEDVDHLIEEIRFTVENSQMLNPKVKDAKKESESWISAELNKLQNPTSSVRKDVPKPASVAAAPQPVEPRKPPVFTAEKIDALIKRAVTQKSGSFEMASWIYTVMTTDRARYTDNDFAARMSDIKVALVVNVLVPEFGDYKDAEQQAGLFIADLLAKRERATKKTRPMPEPGAPRYQAPRREHAVSHPAEAAPATTAKVTGEPKPKPTKLTHAERLAKAEAFKTDLKAGAMKATTKTSEKKPDGADKKKGNKKAQRAAQAQAT